MAALSRPYFVEADGGRTGVIELLLAQHADPNQSDGKGRTPLLLAAASGDAQCLALLLESGASTSAQDKFGRTALWIACGQGWRDGVKALLARGAKPNCRNVNGVTALMLVAAQGDAESVQLLLGAGANVMDQSCRRASALSTACTSGWTASVEQLVTCGASVNQHYEYGLTPLIIASDVGSLELVDYLIVQGADPNLASQPDLDRDFRAGDNYDGRDWMSREPFAADLGYGGIGCGADSIGRRWTAAVGLGRGTTPLIAAAKGHHVDVARSLLAGGANVDARTLQGLSAMHVAVEAVDDEWSPKIVDLLLKAGVDVRDNGGTETILHHLISRNEFAWNEEPVQAIARMLLAAGADPHARDANGDTAAQLVREACYNNFAGTESYGGILHLLADGH